MTNDATARPTPKLRFPEFHDAPGWLPVSLADACVPVVEHVGDRKLTPVSISAGAGFVPQAEKFGRDISGSQYGLYTVVRDGDFVYNKGNSLTFPQGCIYRLRGWGEAAVPNVFICFRLKDGYSNGFFQNCFERNVHGIQLKRHITSSARANGLLNISRERFFSVEIPTPSLPEQQRIADCMTSLDELIGNEGRQLEALKTHKKGLMQQLFPREGETLPRLRFPEFRGAPHWDHQLLGNLEAQKRLEIGRGNVISHKDLRATPGSHPVYSSSAVGDGCMGRYGLFMFDEEMISWSIDGGGRFFYRPKHRFSVTNVCGYMRMLDESLVCRFVAYQLQCLHARETFDYQLKAHPSVIRKLYRLAIPSTREQERIASSLSALDDLIAAQSCRLDTLKTHKRGLMQQLFASPAEAEA